jgi:hypothetical protein
MISKDTCNACLQLFNEKFVKFVAFSQAASGELSYYGEFNNERWEYLFDKKTYGKGKKFLHFFKFHNDTLEWVESYDFDRGMSHIAVDIDDSLFLAVAKEAHDNDITFNEQALRIMKECLADSKTKKGKFKK